MNVDEAEKIEKKTGLRSSKREKRSRLECVSFTFSHDEPPLHEKKIRKMLTIFHKLVPFDFDC